MLGFVQRCLSTGFYHLCKSWLSIHITGYTHAHGMENVKLFILKLLLGQLKKPSVRFLFFNASKGKDTTY
jgi:hypothetical protein